jgi:hypothetical protein
MYFGSNQAFKKLVYAGLLLVMAACLVSNLFPGSLAGFHIGSYIAGSVGGQAHPGSYGITGGI